MPDCPHQGRARSTDFLVSLLPGMATDKPKGALAHSHQWFASRASSSIGINLNFTHPYRGSISSALR